MKGLVVNMDARIKRTMDLIAQGKKPMIIEGVNYCFIADFVNEYLISGYVCGIIGTYESKFKQVNIQATKQGKRYIVADRKRFWIDNIKPAYTLLKNM